MADSDSDYIASSGDEAGAHTVSKKGRHAGKSKSSGKPREKVKERWEEVQRAWDVGLEDDNIETTVAELLEAGKKRRFIPPSLLMLGASR
jgi:transcription initiation factor TFIIH subunit 2